MLCLCQLAGRKVGVVHRNHVQDQGAQILVTRENYLRVGRKFGKVAGLGAVGGMELIVSLLFTGVGIENGKK